MAVKGQITVDDMMRESQTTTLERWAAGERDDEQSQGANLAPLAGILVTLVALCAFFLTFAPAT